MIKKALIAASAFSMVAIPSAASAQYYPAPSYGYGYDNGYYGDTRAQRRYERQQRQYERQQQRYANQYGYNSYGGRRCSGTTGAIVGGVAGALLGREVGRSGDRNSYYGYGRGGSGTTGAIVGGAVGALVGNEVGKRSCR